MIALISVVHACVADAIGIAGGRGQPSATRPMGSMGPPAAGMQMAPSQAQEPPPPFTPEVEDEANAYFQKIYIQPPHNLTIDEVLDMLKRFKESNIRRERVSAQSKCSEKERM